MRAPNYYRSLLMAGLLAAFGCSNGAAAQAGKKATAAKSPAEANLTRQQAQSLNLAWRNLARAYQDLMTAAPDVKGDTTKLEAALRSSIHDLHELDPSLAEAAALQGQDRGVGRKQVFDAVQRHLDLGKQYITESNVKNWHTQHALGQIAIGYGELNADRTAPTK